MLLRKSGAHFSPDKRLALEESQAQLQQRIDAAYSALAAMHNQLESILNPHEPMMAANTDLDALIARVREEAEVARRVRERIEADHLATILSQPPATGSDASTAQPMAEER